MILYIVIIINDSIYSNNNKCCIDSNNNNKCCIDFLILIKKSFGDGVSKSFKLIVYIAVI